MRLQQSRKQSKPQSASRYTPATSYLSYLAAFPVLPDEVTPPTTPHESTNSKDFGNEGFEELLPELESQISGSEDMLA